MEDLKQRVEEVDRILNYERSDIQHASDLARIVYQKQDIQYVKELIKDLAFELSESEFGAEILTNTDAMSQARIKELEEREAKLIRTSQDLLKECDYHIKSTHCPLGLGREIYNNAKATLEELGIANKGEV